LAWRDWKNRTLQIPQRRPIDGWRLGAPDLYTCVAPPGYEKDPAITEAIHSFDPGVIPIWRIQVWLPPHSFEPMLAVHHGIGRHYPYPRQLRREFHVEMPQMATHPVPNFLDCIFEDQEANGYVGPGTYLPWDWWTYRWCRQKFEYLTSQEYARRLARKEEHLARLAEQHAAERQGELDEFSEWARKKLERAGVTPQDWAEYAELLRTRARVGGRRRAVHWLPGSAAVAPPQ
jgi:hypothetical protein